jgi:hypothetical protein
MRIRSTSEPGERWRAIHDVVISAATEMPRTATS